MNVDKLLPRLPTAAVTLVTLAVVWALLPAVASWTRAFVGIEYVDAYGTQWFYHFVDRAIRAGTDPGHTDLLFFPWGKDIFDDTGTNVLDAALAFPFRLLLGPVVGYNVFVVLFTLLSGAAAWPLLGEATQDRATRALGVLACVASPYVLGELVEGRPTQAFLAFPTLFLAALVVSGRRTGVWPPIAAGILLAACGWQYWYYAFFGGMVALAHGIALAVRPPPAAGGRVRLLARHALIAAVSLALTLPYAARLALGGEDGDPVPGFLAVEDWTWSATDTVTVEGIRVGLVVWEPLRWRAGVYLVDEASGVERFLGHLAFVPLGLLPFLALWLLRPGKVDRLPMLAMLGMIATIAAGPAFLVGTWVLPNIPYIELSQWLPFLRRLWWPARAFAFAAPLLALATVAAVEELGRRWGPVARASGIGAAGLAIGLGLPKTPMPMWDATIPAGYQCLATGPEGAILELPYSWTQAHLYWQTAHGRPIFGGMVENNPVFTPTEQTETREKNTWVKAVLGAPMLGARASAPWTPADRDAMRDLGYRYVVFEKDAIAATKSSLGLTDNTLRLRNRQSRTTLARLAGRPVYEDARVAIYAPWGDPSPCAGLPIVPDTSSPGRTEVSAEELYAERGAPTESTLSRPFASTAVAQEQETDEP